MSNTLADFKAGEEDNTNKVDGETKEEALDHKDSCDQENSRKAQDEVEEVRLIENLNILDENRSNSKDESKKEEEQNNSSEILNALEVDKEETGDHKVSERGRRLEKLKRNIEKVKQNIKDGEERESKDENGNELPKLRIHRFRPRPIPGMRKFPGVEQECAKTDEVKDAEEVDNITMQYEEVKSPFPTWPEAAGGGGEGEEKARHDKLRQFQLMSMLRRSFNLAPGARKEPKLRQEPENSLGVGGGGDGHGGDDPDDGGKVQEQIEVLAHAGQGEVAPGVLKEADPEKKKRSPSQAGSPRCSQKECKKKVGLTGFACRFSIISIILCRIQSNFWQYSSQCLLCFFTSEFCFRCLLVFCPLHRCVQIRHFEIMKKKNICFSNQDNEYPTSCIGN